MDKQTEQNLLNIVKRNYEGIAEQFSETRKKDLSTNLWGELIKFTRDISENSSILDVGCGNGRLLKAFEDIKIKYLGVDNNEELLGYAKSLYPDREFVLGDVLELNNIPQLNFDYVFFVAVIHNLPGQDLRLQALKQLRNKVSQNGKIIITAWNLWSQEKYLKLIFKFILLKLMRRMSRRFFRMYSKKSRDPDFALRASGDWGDILFDWKNSKGEKVSQRYYHAFRKGELKKIAKRPG